MKIRRINSLVIQNSSPTKKKPMSVTQQGEKKISETFLRQLKANNKKVRESTGVRLNDIIRSSLRYFICRMCQNNVQTNDTDCISTCGHAFCVDCLTQYSIYKIKINQDVRCPQENCKQKLTSRSPFFQKLPQPIQQKFKQHQIWKQSLQNPNMKLCPSQTCRGGAVDLLKDPPECIKCHKKYCKQCMMESHQGPCDQNFQDHFREWKRCPKCKIFIQKDQGCNHMTCRCGHQFCFVCLSNWDQSHYQCIEGLQDRLFFRSKAIIYLIVMTIFFPILIAIGLLLLVLSIGLTIVIAVIVSPCIAAQQVNKICSCSCLFCLIAWVLLLPIIIIGSVFVAPIFFFISIFKPNAYRILRQYCNTMSFFWDQIKGQNRQRRHRRPQIIQQI